MRRFSVILALPLFLGCSAPVTTSSWGDATMRLAVALEQSGAGLQEQAVAPFLPDSPEMLSVSLTSHAISNAFARQVVAWKALDAYTADVARILNSNVMEVDKVQELARAFHDLHRRLLFSDVADYLGLNIEEHREAVQQILAASSAVSALGAAQPSINTLCDHFAEGSRRLTSDLDDWLDTCLRQVDSKWRDRLDGYAVLLARKKDLEREIAAQAAGAAPQVGDPSGELLKVETLLRNSESWRRDYAADQEGLAAAFDQARDHVQKTAHAALEWGIAHRELVKALRSDSTEVNLRLLDASVEELAL
ncbi:MAG: hypothetical protein ACPG31_05755 [Planctomycetota bacterium]